MVVVVVAIVVAAVVVVAVVVLVVLVVVVVVVVYKRLQLLTYGMYDTAVATDTIRSNFVDRFPYTAALLQMRLLLPYKLK